MNCSTPGLPVHHQLPEFTQTHVHRVSDAIQPSHPLSSPSPPAPNPSQHQSFSNESTLRMRWPKYWSFNFKAIGWATSSVYGIILREGALVEGHDWNTRCTPGPTSTLTGVTAGLFFFFFLIVVKYRNHKIYHFSHF